MIYLPRQSELKGENPDLLRYASPSVAAAYPVSMSHYCPATSPRKKHFGSPWTSGVLRRLDQGSTQRPNCQPCSTEIRKLACGVQKWIWWLYGLSPSRRGSPARCLSRRDKMNTPIASARLPGAAAAAYTGMAASTLNKLRVFGGGPVFIKIGRRVLYDTTDLNTWLTANRRISTSDSST